MQTTPKSPKTLRSLYFQLWAKTQMDHANFDVNRKHSLFTTNMKNTFDRKHKTGFRGQRKSRDTAGGGAGAAPEGKSRRERRAERRETRM